MQHATRIPYWIDGPTEGMSGRFREWFAVDRWGVAPDLVTFAKGVNSGYVPLGGVIISDAIAATFEERPYPSGLTYSHLWPESDHRTRRLSTPFLELFGLPAVHLTAYPQVRGLVRMGWLIGREASPR